MPITLSTTPVCVNADAAFHLTFKLAAHLAALHAAGKFAAISAWVLPVVNAYV